jgi:prevent-host-death family protein
MQIPAGKFKTNCLKLMDDILKSHEEITVTKHGRPVAKLIPINPSKEKRALFGFLKNTVSINGDIVESTGEVWDADQ